MSLINLVQHSVESTFDQPTDQSIDASQSGATGRKPEKLLPNIASPQFMAC
jgi:hypothetical protein